MGISIYYRFESNKNLGLSGYLKGVEKSWSELCGGSPYETWSWYEPTVEKGLFKKTKYHYEGATQLPMDEEEGPMSLAKALQLLTKIRNEVGGSGWSVNLDDLQIPWDEQSQSYTIDM